MFLCLVQQKIRITSLFQGGMDYFFPFSFYLKKKCLCTSSLCTGWKVLLLVLLTADSQTKSLVPENSKIYTDSGQTPVGVGPPLGWVGPPLLSSSVLPPSMRTVPPIKSISPPPIPWWQWKHSHPLWWTASRAVSWVTCHHHHRLAGVSVLDIQWSIFKDSCGCTVPDMPELREMTNQTASYAKQPWPSHEVCVWEDLKCWEAWDTTCWSKQSWGHYSTDCLKERCRKWKRLMIFDGKDEKGTSTIKLTLEPFQRQCRGNFWEGVEHTYRPCWAPRYYLELIQTRQTRE